MRPKKDRATTRSEIIEQGNVVFTASPEESNGARPGAALPPPFRVAARTCLLVSATRPRLAVLGWGLGAMGGEMARLRPEAHLLGVELSADLARRAQKHLPDRVELLHGDALSFLERTRRRFDLLLDDCFSWQHAKPVRPPELLRHGDLARRRLRPGGLYVRNMLPEPHLPLALQTEDLHSAFEHVELRRFREWDNVLAVCTERPLPSDWRALLRTSASTSVGRRRRSPCA